MDDNRIYGLLSDNKHKRGRKCVGGCYLWTTAAYTDFYLTTNINEGESVLVVAICGR